MAKGNEKKFVKIQSSVNIRVTAGLQFEDYTKRNSDVPNRMKVAPVWQKMMCQILVGQHTYPSEIVEWPTVKRLQADGILTIGEFTDADGDNASEVKRNINEAKAEIEGRSLSDIAGD